MPLKASMDSQRERERDQQRERLFGYVEKGTFADVFLIAFQ